MIDIECSPEVKPRIPVPIPITRFFPIPIPVLIIEWLPEVKST